MSARPLTPRQRLERARRGALQVHRALLEAERIGYEKQHGRVESSGALLQLVLHDPWFAWLRPLSELIVQMDDWLDEDRKTPSSPDLAEILLAQLRDRLRPDAAGAEFQQRYYRQLQDHPAVAVTHAETRLLINA